MTLAPAPLLAGALALGLVSAAAAQPSAYVAEDIVFDNPAAGVRLAATLTLPEGNGPFPAAVLITGAGPQDRDATNAGHKPFAVLADHLSSRGFAVLRYDDRGVGGSTGDTAKATWLDLAADAEAAVDYLGAREQIDPHAIGLVGHSLGGIIAPIAAADDGDVAFVVSLAGPSTDFIELTLSQRRAAALAQGAPEAAIARTEPVLAHIFSVMADADGLEAAREAVRQALTAERLAALGAPESARDALVSQLASEPLYVSLHYNPRRTLPRVDVPVLAITGTLDSVVDADENLAAIEAALARNPDVTTVKLEGLNHFFQTAVTGDPGEYGELEESFAPAALETVSDWIGARFGAR